MITLIKLQQTRLKLLACVLLNQKPYELRQGLFSRACLTAIIDYRLKGNSMHRLKTLLLSPILLLMGLLASAPAIAQYYPGHPGYPAPQHPRTTVETANIQSYLDRNKRIDLARALRLSNILNQGRELRAITVRGSSNMGARLTLTHNGRQVDSVA